jgi:hypothetical protein
MRKIYLFKCFEKTIKDNYPIATIEMIKDTDVRYDFIITNLDNLKSKKEYYYNALDDQCIFKNDRTKSVIAIYEGNVSIESHKNDYLGIT